MPKYDIERWDALITGNNTFPTPMIYFKPDKDFVKYAEDNEFQVLVEIEGTDSIYDKKKMYGTIDSSAYSPGYRPRFYNKTGYFVITLACNWTGYPKQNGRMIVRGLKGPDKIELPESKPFEPPKAIRNEFEYYPRRNKECNNLTTSQIGWTLTLILVVFAVLLFISQKNNTIVQ